MILHDICGSEGHASYQALELSNGDRQLNFCKSMVIAAGELNRPLLSQAVIKALNFHAIVCLHTSAGQFRPCEVHVGQYNPPPHYLVQGLMDDFVNNINRWWETTDPVYLSAFVLWRLNNIHPFINGNGRTARVASYYVLCLKLGGWLKGKVLLPELIKRDRPEYVKILQDADASSLAGNLDLAPMHAFLTQRLEEQMKSEDAAT